MKSSVWLILQHPIMEEIRWMHVGVLVLCMTEINFTDTRARKIISFYSQTFGHHGSFCNHHHSAPCMHLRRWHAPSDFPWQNDETMQRIIDDAIQIYMCESMWLIAQNRNHTRRTSMVMPSNNNTAETYTNMALQRYAWQMKETTRSVFAPCPYFGNLIGGTQSSLFSDNS